MVTMYRQMVAEKIRQSAVDMVRARGVNALQDQSCEPSSGFPSPWLTGSGPASVG